MEHISDSQTGKYFIIAYILFTLGLLAGTLVCTGEACDAFIVLPIMPWAYLLATKFQLSFPFVVYPVLLLLNVSIAYTLGALIDLGVSSVRNRKKI